MVRLRDKTKKLASEVFKDVLKEILKHWFLYLLFGGGIIFVWKFSQKLIHLLLVKTTLPLWLLIPLLFITILISYKLGKPRKQRFEQFFFDYRGFKWSVNVSFNPQEICVEEVPYCIKCKVKYVWRDASFVFDTKSILMCPFCSDKKEDYDISAMHSAVENIVEANIKGYLKKD